MATLGRPPIGAPIQIRIPPPMLDQIDRICDRTGDNRSTTMRMLIEIALDDYEWSVA